MSYASHLAIVNATRSVTQIAITSRWGKVLIFKPKALSFYTTEFSHMNFFPQKIDQIFGFWVGKLSRHIWLNPTNIALLLQEATQKYWKLKDYWTKSCSLFALLSVYCDLCFLPPSSMAEFSHFLNTVLCKF